MPSSTPMDHRAQQREAISTAVVGVLHDYTGRGAPRAWTMYEDDLVVVLLEGTMTTAESALAESGEREYVVALRRKVQQTMRDDLEGAVEDVTGRRVIAFLSDSHIDPDVSAETFVLEPGGAATGERGE
jgi:uncharacterized protein YbcI